MSTIVCMSSITFELFDDERYCNLLGVTQGHWKRRHSIDCVRQAPLINVSLFFIVSEIKPNIRRISRFFHTNITASVTISPVTAVDRLTLTVTLDNDLHVDICNIYFTNSVVSTWNYVPMLRQLTP